MLLHTGQNFTPALSDVFFGELGLREPDIHLGIRATTFADQLARIIRESDAAMARVAPDRVLILGDTNSGLAAIAAARRGIPVYHLEAGNRSYDPRIPEEVNRRVIDHASTVLMPYTERSKENLVREGIRRDRIFVIGNPIFEVLQHHASAVDASEILSRLDLREKGYLAATLHRSENVDAPERLAELLRGIERCAEAAGVVAVVSTHPHTADRVERAAIDVDEGLVRMLPPLGFCDFVRLERHALAVLSDSGTVQEECSILRVPNVIIRDVTERAETIEVGGSVLGGTRPADMVMALRVALAGSLDWSPPAEYLVPNVSSTVAKIVLGFRYEGALY